MSTGKLFFWVLIGAVAYGLIARLATGQTGTPFSSPLG